MIRVAMFERFWQRAVRLEVELDFRSDPDHRIEHTIQEVRDELIDSGLACCEMQTIWGEIWATCQPRELTT